VTRSKAPSRPPQLGARSRWSRIWATVDRIPRGRVATYGQIAELAGLGGHARQVGYALAALPDGARTPWQRVINSKGEISERAAFDGAPRQRLLLLEEGVVFGPDGRVDLKRFGWRPRRMSRAKPGRR
jgi:methylated-DNA-protein-cysteine methyltransferase-like protein